MNERAMGNAGRDEGISRSINRANREIPRWSDEAYEFLLAVIAEGRLFIAPDIRKRFEGEGHRPPPAAQAWGGVFRRAANLGLIERHDAVMYGDETMNTQLVTRWRPRGRANF